jgi:hypothetical protein
MNVFLIETPHQLLNAIEAKNTLELTDNHLFIVILDGYPENSYKPLVVYEDWEEVRFIPSKIKSGHPIAEYFRTHPSERVRNYYDTFVELRNLRKRLDEIARSVYGVENLFLGNYFKVYTRHFSNIIKPQRLCLLDDGNATLFINTMRKQDSPVVRVQGYNTIKDNIIYNIIGLNIKQAENITFFTTYDLETIDGDSIIKNEYRYFRKMMELSQPCDEVFFLGSTMASEGFPEDLYMKYMAMVQEYFKEENFVYIPHKCEPEERVNCLKQTLGMNVKRFDVPIEYQLSVRGTIPKVLTSFFSSALENCRVIFGPHLHIKSFYIDPVLFPLAPDFVKDVYDYYRSKSSPYFEVVDL